MYLRLCFVSERKVKSGVLGLNDWSRWETVHPMVSFGSTSVQLAFEFSSLPLGDH